MRKFSFVLVGAPDFPPELKTNTARAFADLRNDLTTLAAFFEGQAGTWVSIALNEIDASERAYERGDLREGKDLIQRAEVHVRNAVRGKPTRPTFQVAPDGTVDKA
jgi:hypothetical protein